MADREIINKIVWKQDQASANAVIKGNEAIGKSLTGIREASDSAYEALVKQAEAERQLKAVYKTGDVAQIARFEADRAEAAQRHADNANVLRAAQERANAAADKAIAAENRLRDLRAGWRQDVEAVVAYDKALQEAAAAAERLAQAEARRTANATINSRIAQADAVRASRESGGFVGDLRNELLGGAGDVVGGAGGAARGNNIGRRIYSVGRAIYNAPAIGASTPASRGIMAAGSAIQAIGASAAQVALAAGLAAPAVVAVAVALHQFNEAIAEHQRRLQGALQAQDNYYRAVVSMSADEARERIAELERVRTAQQQQLDTTRAALNAGFENAQRLVGGQVTFVGDAIARTLDNQLGISDLREKANQLETQLAATGDEITLLNNGLANNAFAAGDAAKATEEAAEAERKLQQAREQAAQELIGAFQREADLRLQLSDMRRGGSLDQLQAFYAANNDQIAIIRNFLLPAVESMGLSTEAATQKTRELNTQIDYLTHANELARQSVEGVIRQREAEAALLEALAAKSDGVNEGLRELEKITLQLGEASKKAAEAQQALREAETEHRANIQKINDDFDDKAVKSRAQLNAKLEQIDAQSAERIRQQKENDNLSIEAAIARGDIAAAQEVLARQRLRIEQERRANEERKAEAEKDADERLEAAREQHEKQLEAERERYDKERQQRQRAHAQALQDERALLSAQEAQRSLNAFRTQYYANVVQAANAAVGASHLAAAAQIAQAAAQVRQVTATYVPLVGARDIGAPPVQYNPAHPNLMSNARAQSDAALAAFYAGYGGLPQPAPGYVNPHVFDTPSYNTKPGIYRSLVPEFHIPMADFNRLGGFGERTVYQTNYIDATGMDADELADSLMLRVKKLDEDVKIDVFQRLARANRSVRNG